MPRSVSTNRIGSCLPGKLIPIKSSRVEISAHNLMDELFAELEQDLAVSALSTRVSAQTVLRSGHHSETMVSTWAATQERLTPNPHLENDPLDLDADLSFAPESSTESARLEAFSARIAQDRGLLTITSVALVLPLLLWIGSQIQRPKAVTSPAPSPPVVSHSETDAGVEFASYLQRSLDLIDQKAQVASQTAPAPALPPTAVMTPSTTPNPAPASLDVVKLPERIYIPVYQPPQVAKTQPPQQSKQAKPKPSAKASAPLPIQAAPPAPLVSIKSASTQTLIGILDLGDRSAALVSSNGVTRRVRVGEALGPGGWSLAKVSNQKAIIQGRGELRSIDVGQQF